MASMNSEEEQPVKPQKKIYPRKLTDKRREQNRQAQKNYRERQRRKIEELEKKVEEQSSLPPTATAFSSSNLLLNATTTAPIGEPAPYVASTRTNFFTTKTFPDINFQLFEASEEIPGPAFGDFGLAIRTGENPSSQEAQNQSFHYDENVLFPTSVEEDAAALWPSPPLSETLDQMSTVGPAKSSSSAPRTRNTQCSEQTAHNIPSSTALVASSTRSSSPTPARRSTEPAFRDNHIILAAERCLGAMFEIAAHLGITRESYAYDYESPFYSPRSFNATCLPVQAVARIDADAYTYLQPDLRPSPTQVAFSHFSYLDCIIWPRFRERAIRAAIEDKLNHIEFFLDITNDGLVCWGNQQNRKGKGMDRGIAWDQRSWEARPWFVKKWAWLVGGDDDEVARGSRWWRFMRGERDD